MMYQLLVKDEGDRGALGLGMECLMGFGETRTVHRGKSTEYTAACDFDILRPSCFQAFQSFPTVLDEINDMVAGHLTRWLWLSPLHSRSIHFSRRYGAASRSSIAPLVGRSTRILAISEAAQQGGLGGSNQRRLRAGELGLCRPAHSSHVLALVAGRHLHMYHGGAALCSLAAVALDGCL
ncbi:conserved hypothetical protein [Coccidioides posadasii str. Silveira]|uniref:Uncharacterized protein n=1 Tax=Coccidioides posadasii (strain RMSCC 757 / Silveira) TaxID=443226 RepID=E9DFI4_COCPS|nr:conserved hypothetical protein [Coccidioides posadasii str. Silveira]